MTDESPTGNAMPNQSLIEHSLSEMRSDMSEMRLGLQQIAEAVTRLAVVEERNKNLESTISRIEDRVEKMDERQRSSEITRDVVLAISTRLNSTEALANVNQMNYVALISTMKGVTSAMKYMWATVGSVVGFFCIQIFNVLKAAV